MHALQYIHLTSHSVLKKYYKIVTRINRAYISGQFYIQKESKMCILRHISQISAVLITPIHHQREERRTRKQRYSYSIILK